MAISLPTVTPPSPKLFRKRVSSLGERVSESVSNASRQLGDKADKLGDKVKRTRSSSSSSNKVPLISGSTKENRQHFQLQDFPRDF